MSSAWPLVALGEVLAERKEVPSQNDIEMGRIRIIAKIGFHDGKIQLRTGSETKTGMILVRQGDLVVSGINAAKGAIAISESSAPIAGTIHYGSYIPDTEKVSTKYLWWLLRSNFFRELLYEHVPGGIKTELKAKRFLLVPVPIPPLAEQRRRLRWIEELAAKIVEARELRRQAVEEAEALINSASRQLFCSSANNKTAPFVTVCTNIIDCLHSNAIYADTGIPTLRSPDVGWGKLFPETALKTSEDEYLRRTRRGELLPGDIIIVREGGGTGKAGIVEEGQKMSLGQRVMQVRPDSRVILPKLLLYQWLSPTIQQDHIVPLSKGSASPHLNIGSIKKFPIVLPPLEDQHRIVTYLDNLQAKVDSLKHLQAETAAELDTMLPSILDKAFKGEL